MVLNEEQWIKELREKRIAYGISQGRLAVASGITREYLNKIESGKMKPSKELLETLHKELASVIPKLSVSCQPRQVVKSPCGSASMSSTFFPCIARPTPRFTVVVVFPTPPF